jgi:hypothetical protein
MGYMKEKFLNIIIKGWGFAYCGFSRKGFMK